MLTLQIWVRQGSNFVGIRDPTSIQQSRYGFLLIQSCERHRVLKYIEHTPTSTTTGGNLRYIGLGWTAKGSPWSK